MNFRHDDASEGAAGGAFFSEGPTQSVLVVDDSPEIRQLIARLLATSGYRVLEAPDGVTAQVILQNEEPALVISDLEMPGGNGWSLLTYCREFHPGLPVLIASGRAKRKGPEIELLADGFVAKPFSLSRLLREIRRLVGRRP